jgi:hypothetical protein
MSRSQYELHIAGSGQLITPFRQFLAPILKFVLKFEVYDMADDYLFNHLYLLVLNNDL